MEVHAGREHALFKHVRLARVGVRENGPRDRLSQKRVRDHGRAIGALRESDRRLRPVNRHVRTLDLESPPATIF